jgi:signal transduction histidine kinase/ActR/RegA family two-component response regulator
MASVNPLASAIASAPTLRIIGLVGNFIASRSIKNSAGNAIRLAAGLILAAAIISGSEYGALILAHNFGGSLVIWPPEAIVLALMLGPFRDRPWLMLLVGEITMFATSTMVSQHSIAPLVLLLDRTGGLREAFIYLAVMHFSGGQAVNRSRGLLTLLMAAVVASVAGGAVHAISFHWLYHWPTLQFFITGSASAIVGYTVITPLLLILTNVGEIESINRKTLLRAAGVLTLYCGVCFVVMFQSAYPLLFLIPLSLMAVCYIVDLASVALAVLATAAIAVGCTLVGHGPITLAHGDFKSQLLVLQAFLVIITATTLPIAALMAEHDRLKRSLIAARVDADAANHTKSMFLATMSHEIRTPLNGVLGMAQVIAMDELSPAQRERIGVISRSGQALLSILNDILDISKIEAGKLTLETIEFSLGDTIRSAAQSYESLAKETSLEVKLDVGGAEGVYLGDPTRVRQILYNLMSNAFKFTPHGSITLAAAYGDGVLQLTVSDTGIGIPTEKLDRLFGKFSQVDASTTRKFGGSGLGLSICRELASLMGGTIEVESEEGRGSEFKVRLPMDRISETATADPEHDTPICNDMSTLRVLAAEDNPTNQLVLKTLLQFAEVDVVIVENGAQALEAWSAQAWDLILMDVQMPVMDGPTATREIRRREAEQRLPRTPIIALTANTMSHQIAEYMAAGMDGHIAKPIEADALFQALSSIGDAGELFSLPGLADVG